MIPGTRDFKLFSVLFFLAALFICFTFPCPVSAFTEVEVNPVNTPAGAVILIVDGLSAPFIYPELTPHALDGAVLEKTKLENIPKISENSARVLNFCVPQTFTEGGHSVLVTGNPGADSELVSFKDATIFDILHKRGYLCIAVMEKGDSWSICAEQDVILKDGNNSIKDMEIVLEQHKQSEAVSEIPEGLLQLLKKSADKAPEYITSKEMREKYNGYNRWGVDTACAAIEYMEKNKPGQKYLLTVNVGAVDMSGHYRDNYGYIDCIESLDSDLPKLYELCKKNNLAFILTGDHGMSFSKDNSKGGHQSEKFSSTEEAQLVPLIVHANGIKSGIIREEHKQEDFTPTLLGILDIPEKPRFAEGEQILLTGHVNLQVKLPEKGSIELKKDVKTLTSLKDDDEFLFLGLEPENTYFIGATLDSGKSLEEQEKVIFLKNDSVVEFKEKGHENLKAGSETDFKGNNSVAGILKENSWTSGPGLKHLTGYLVIGVINLAGIMIIASILKKN
jgi:bisphosphoglycerate-independent phosphoglycerate mutase (AlkP superfamily)